eukprot:scaffold253991_cov35-Tisochrysis_lutea.AAC.1
MCMNIASESSPAGTSSPTSEPMMRADAAAAPLNSFPIAWAIRSHNNCQFRPAKSKKVAFRRKRYGGQ